ncbi:MAG: hypothetical protein IT477_10595 [Rhodanobacteraceae bacterium]|nr:hypothetical protein [Rhodanobacteraceae bacterium]
MNAYRILAIVPEAHAPAPAAHARRSLRVWLRRFVRQAKVWLYGHYPDRLVLLPCDTWTQGESHIAWLHAQRRPPWWRVRERARWSKTLYLCGCTRPMRQRNRY